MLAAQQDFSILARNRVEQVVDVIILFCDFSKLNVRLVIFRAWVPLKDCYLYSKILPQPVKVKRGSNLEDGIEVRVNISVDTYKLVRKNFNGKFYLGNRKAHKEVERQIRHLCLRTTSDSVCSGRRRATVAYDVAEL